MNLAPRLTVAVPLAIETASKWVPDGIAVESPASLSALVGPARSRVTAARSTALVIGTSRPETPSFSPLIR